MSTRAITKKMSDELVRLRARVAVRNSRIAELLKALRPFAEREEAARIGDEWDRAASGLGCDRSAFIAAARVYAAISTEVKEEK